MSPNREGVNRRNIVRDTVGLFPNLGTSTVVAPCCFASAFLLHPDTSSSDPRALFVMFILVCSMARLSDGCLGKQCVAWRMEHKRTWSAVVFSASGYNRKPHPEARSTPLHYHHLRRSKLVICNASLPVPKGSSPSSVTSTGYPHGTSRFTVGYAVDEAAIAASPPSGYKPRSCSCARLLNALEVLQMIVGPTGGTADTDPASNACCSTYPARADRTAAAPAAVAMRAIARTSVDMTHTTASLSNDTSANSGTKPPHGSQAHTSGTRQAAPRSELVRDTGTSKARVGNTSVMRLL